MSGIGRVTLIDRDTYEKKNLLSQDITPQDVGRSKAAVQARRLRRINPALRVDVIVDAVQNVPLGQLRADIILACLDSRTARQYVNQAAWRLGVLWIDSGVEGRGLLARVNVYVPGPDTPCLECAWDEQDYEALEQTYPCQGETGEPAPTNASSSLGALAASLQAIECQKLLSHKSRNYRI
jgi:adenylyltransferase/sulfurtransferase